MIDLSEKQVITEHDLKDIAAGSQIRIAENAILTPLALDLISSRKLEITIRKRQARLKRVAISADHGGYEMKEHLKKYLSELGYEYHDFGTHDTRPVDYPDYAFMVASAVSQGRFPLGIIIDGAGVGSCMTANKVPGVRAAMAYNAAIARNSREHNDANVLTLGGKFISTEQMRDIVKTWLEASISEERHLKRVEKIKSIEKKFLR